MMKGKLYRRNKDGYIYEVIEADKVPGMGTRWALWNDRAGERQFAMEIELERQVGWELVGTAQGAEPLEELPQAIPAALMK
jgi:hypothetical protein